MIRWLFNGLIRQLSCKLDDGTKFIDITLLMPDVEDEIKDK